MNSKKEYKSTWYQANKERLLPLRRVYWAGKRQKVLDILGSVCACCGEDQVLFLEIDHIHGVSDEEKEMARKSGKYRISGLNLHLYVLKHPWEFQMLCSNCNRGKARNGGVCPHAQNS